MRKYKKNWLNPADPGRNSLVSYRPTAREAGEFLTGLAKELNKVLVQSGEIAARMGEKAYLVGGLLRDLYYNYENYDLDLVYTGKPEPFLKHLAVVTGGNWTVNPRFGTGSIAFEGEIKLDLARPRQERYARPGTLPEIRPVEADKLKLDIYRRDYTVNGLLLELSPGKWGRLIDFFQGEGDLQKRLLRVFHRQSFLDDPTRIIRGLRLAARRNMRFEKLTERYLREALETDFPALSNFRVLREIRFLLQEPLTERLYGLLNSFPIFRLLKLPAQIPVNFNKVRQLEEYLEYYQKKNYNIKEWLLRLAVVFPGLEEGLLSTWELPGEDKAILTTISRKKGLLTSLDRELPPSTLGEYLSGLTIEELILLLINTKDAKISENIQYYLEDLAWRELEISGQDLLNEGFTPGPELGNILDKVYAARLEGLVHSRKEELEYARKLKAKHDWSET